MGTNKALLNISNFTGGLNTEATALTILPSEMMDGTINVELLNNGSVRRRRGIDFLGKNPSNEIFNAYVNFSTSGETYGLVSSVIHARISAPNGTTVDRVIHFINNEFRVYESTEAALKNPLSPLQTIDTGDGLLLYADQKFYNMDFEIAADKVFFVGRFTQPGYLKIKSDNSTFDLVHYDVITSRLVNTGAGKRVKHGTPAVGYECTKEHDPADYLTDLSEPGVGANWGHYWQILENFEPSGLAAWSSSDPVYVTRFEKLYNIEDTPGSTDSYPTTVEFYAGRIWLSGDPLYPNRLQFTQVIQSDSQIPRFHSVADPFDTNDPDVVDSDGGVILTQGCGTIYRMVAVDDYLFYGANNKVFYIGGADSIFKATNFYNKELLNEGILGWGNLVKAESTIIIFGEHNIYQSNKELDTYLTTKVVLNNLTDNKLTTYYRDVPNRSKAAAKLLYSPAEKRLYWFHNKETTTWDTTRNPYFQPAYFTHALVHLMNKEATGDEAKRTVTKAFTLYEYGDTAPDGLILTCPFVTPVFNTADGLSNYILFLAHQRRIVTTNTYYDIAFGKLYGSTLQDWAQSTDYVTDYVSRIVSGLQTGGDIFHNKSAPYMFFVFKRIEQGTLNGLGEDDPAGSCLLYTAWNYANTGSAKYKGPFQIYKGYRIPYTPEGASATEMSHIWFKHRVRGNGHALQLIFQSEGAKDFHLLGWTEQLYGKGN